MWKKLRRQLQPGSRILDFGGGDGRLMRPFVDNGHRCFVVDYSPNMVPGVERVASTLEEVPTGSAFDFVVCSHVIEHVAEPLEVLSKLGDLLRNGGGIYVEVPLEIWRKAPLHEEPVTHVNFFTMQSMDALLARAGFSELNTRMDAYEYVPGHILRVVASVARKQSEFRVSPQYDGAADATRRLLNPGISTRINRALLAPSQIPASIAYRLKKFISLR